MRRLVWLVVLAGGCNQLYGLDETTVLPGMMVPDLDGDFVADVDDNCPGSPNPDQADRDADRFGDACDFCPDAATAVNHDEDADTHGDACDFCPVHPDFQRDGDGDRVGDACDNDFATQNALRLFDPFLGLDPMTWRADGAWSALGDAVTGDPQARLTALVGAVDATRPFTMSIGISSSEAWRVGDRFGVELVAGGNVIASCTVGCASLPCTLDLVPDALDMVNVDSTPVMAIDLRRTPFLLACVAAGAVSSYDSPTITGDAHLALVGNPRVQFRSVAVWQ